MSWVLSPGIHVLYIAKLILKSDPAQKVKRILIKFSPRFTCGSSEQSGQEDSDQIAQISRLPCDITSCCCCIVVLRPR